MGRWGNKQDYLQGHHGTWDTDEADMPLDSWRDNLWITGKGGLAIPIITNSDTTVPCRKLARRAIEPFTAASGA